MSAASAPVGLESLDLPDPDECFDDLAFGDSNDPTEFVKPGKKDGLQKGFGMDESSRYILGTLIIRVVAARDLQVRVHSACFLFVYICLFLFKKIRHNEKRI